MPPDITIVHNTITANPKWQHEPVNVKSRLELKNAKHVLIEDNEISQCWGGHGQDGYLLSMTVRNQYGEHAVGDHRKRHRPTQPLPARGAAAITFWPRTTTTSPAG